MKATRPLIALLLLTGCSTSDSSRAATADTAAGPAYSQTATAHEPTANDIADYKLDMDKMRKYAAAMKGFSALAKTDSAAAGMMETHPNETTAQIMRRIESSPAAMKVLREVGLTPKDYVWITAAWLQAAMTQAVLESSKEARLPEGQNAQNIEFLQAHRTELEAMTRDFERQ